MTSLLNALKQYKYVWDIVEHYLKKKMKKKYRKNCSFIWKKIEG